MRRPDDDASPCRMQVHSEAEYRKVGPCPKRCLLQEVLQEPSELPVLWFHVPNRGTYHILKVYLKMMLVITYLPILEVWRRVNKREPCNISVNWAPCGRWRNMLEGRDDSSLQIQMGRGVYSWQPPYMFISLP